MPGMLTKDGDSLYVDLSGFRGGEFMDNKEKVKEIDGRRWNPEKKLWSVPATPENAERILKTIRPDVEPDVLNWVRESKVAAQEAVLAEIPKDADLLLPWAKRRMKYQPEVVNDEKFKGLLPYQRAGVDAVLTPERDPKYPGEAVARAILGDDMGLGKTIQAIATVEEYVLRNAHRQPVGPKLVVCPNSVKGSWMRELRRWLPPDTPVYIIEGSAAKRTEMLEKAIAEDAWVIINWEQLRVEKVKVKKKTRAGGYRTTTETRMKQPLLESTDWLAVLADEVHKAKNRDASQTKGLWRVRGRVMLGMTGTALLNSPDELWSILRWLWPDEFHERGKNHGPNAMAYWDFYMKFVDYWEDHFKRKMVTGVKNPDQLRFLLTGKLVRRTAKILKLKGRKRIFYPVPLNPGQRRLYEEAEKAMWLEIAQDAEAGDKHAQSLIARLQAGEEINTATMLRIPNGAARTVRLQQIIESPALLGGPDDSGVLDDLEEKIEASGDGQQWTVFVKFVETCDLVKARLKDKYGLEVGIYNGTVTPAERTELEDAYQRGDIDVMVGTIAAMYQGITLTSGHLQYWVSRDWTPAVNEQGEARNDRLGQQELVTIYIPLAEDTVASDKVQPKNKLKESIVSTVLVKDAIKEVNL